MLKLSIVLGGVLVAGLAATGSADAQTVMQQCGQQYQAAKAGGTLNGLTWTQYRTECAARLKTTPVSTAPAPAPAATPAPAAVPAQAAVPAPAAEPPASPTTTAAAPTTMTKSGKPISAGRTAMLTRERQCGAEWRAQKVSLVAQTPGLTWPKYWSQCNTRLKSAGQ